MSSLNHNTNDEQEKQLDANEVEEVHSVTWLRRRKHTTYLVYLYALLFGCEYSAIVLTLYLYLEKSVKTKNIKVFFSLGMGAMSIMASVSGLLCGHYVDKTRRIRHLVLFCIPITIAGNFLYCIHFSAWFIVVGRLLCGVGEAINSALTGELSRVYSPNDLVKVMYKLQSTYTFGFVLGPAFNILFLEIDIHLGAWNLNKYNFIGVFLATILTIYYSLAYFYLNDLSNQNQDEISLSANPDGELGKVPHQSEWIDVVASFPVVVLTLSSSFNNFISVITELIIPILSNISFMWTIEKLSIVTTICVVVFALGMIVVGARSLIRAERIFYIYMACLVGLCVSMSILTLPGYITVNQMVEQVVLIGVVILINSCCGLMSVALAKTMYLMIVPSENASFYEGVRCIVYRTFGLIGFLSASFMFPYLYFLGPLCVVVLLVFLLLLYSGSSNLAGDYSYSQIRV